MITNFIFAEYLANDYNSFEELHESIIDMHTKGSIKRVSITFSAHVGQRYIEIDGSYIGEWDFNAMARARMSKEKPKSPQCTMLVKGKRIPINEYEIIKKHGFLDPWWKRLFR